MQKIYRTLMPRIRDSHIKSLIQIRPISDGKAQPVPKFDNLCKPSYKEVLQQIETVGNQNKKQDDYCLTAQDKLFCAKLDAMEARLINEFHRSNQDTRRWTSLLGILGLTLGVQFLQYHQNKRIQKNHEQLTRSTLLSK